MRSTKRRRAAAGSGSDADDDVLPAQHRKRAIDAMESRLASLMGEVSSLHGALEELRKRHRELEVQNGLLLKQQVATAGFKRSIGGPVVDQSAPVVSHDSVSDLASSMHFSHLNTLGTTSPDTDASLDGLQPVMKYGKATTTRNVMANPETSNTCGKTQDIEISAPLLDDYSKLTLCLDFDMIWDKMFDDSETAEEGIIDTGATLVAGSATGTPQNASKPNHLSASSAAAAPPAPLYDELRFSLIPAAVTSTPSLPATSDCPSSAPSQPLTAACSKDTAFLLPSPFMQVEHGYLCKPQTLMPHPETIPPSGRAAFAPMTSAPQTITAANGIPFIVPPLPQRSSTAAAAPASGVRLPAASSVPYHYRAPGSTAGAGSDTPSDEQQQPGRQAWWQHPDHLSQGMEFCPTVSGDGDCRGTAASVVVERQGSTPTAMWAGTPICQHNNWCSAATSGGNGMQSPPALMPHHHSLQLPEESAGPPAAWQSWCGNGCGSATDPAAEWSPVAGGQGDDGVALVTSPVVSATGSGKLDQANAVAPAFTISTGVPNAAAAVALPLMPSHLPPAASLPAPTSLPASPSGAAVSALGGPGGQALEAGVEVYPKPLEQCGSNSPGSLNGAVGPRTRLTGRALPTPPGPYGGTWPSQYGAPYINASPYTAPYPLRYVSGPAVHPGRWRRVPGRLPLPLPAGAPAAGPAALPTSPLPFPKHMPAHAPPHASAFGAPFPLPDPYMSRHSGFAGVPNSRLSIAAGQSWSCGV